MSTLEIATLERHIEAILAEYPELQDDETLRADMLEGSTEIGEILTRLTRKARHAAAMAGACATEIADLEVRQSRFERQEKGARALLLRIMETANLRKMELPIATLSIRDGQPSVVITDEHAIPPKWTRTKVEPDRARIKEALKNNVAIPGAALSNGAPSLMMKVK